MANISPIRKQGFSLLELLIVLAAIAIVAAILFPVFASAREKSRQSNCISNNKQIGLAILQYVQDHDEHFPSGRTVTSTSTAAKSLAAGVGWTGEVYPYFRKAQVLHCLDDPTASTAASDTVPTLYPISYSYNVNVAGGASFKSASVTSLTASASTVLLSEVKGVLANVVAGSELPSAAIPTYSSAGDGINTLFWNDKNDNALISGAIQYDGGVPAGYHCDIKPNPPRGCSGFSVTNISNGRHSQGGIYFLADGHAKYQKGGAISAGVNATTSASDQTVKGSTVYAAGTSTLGIGHPSAYNFTYSTK